MHRAVVLAAPATGPDAREWPAPIGLPLEPLERCAPAVVDAPPERIYMLCGYFQTLVVHKNNAISLLRGEVRV